MLIDFGNRNGQNGRIGEFESNVAVHQIQIQTDLRQFQNVRIGAPGEEEPKKSTNNENPVLVRARGS